jgi:hypothetical protein
MPATKRTSGKRSRNRGTRAALTIATAIVVLFTFASLVFHYFVPRTANYCGPLGDVLAKGLDKVFGWFSLLGAILVALLGILYLRRGKSWRPFTGTLVWSSGLFTLASLLSYQVHLQRNLGGVVGNWFGGLLVMGFGFGAYAFAAIAVPWGLNIWLKRPAGKDLAQTGFILLVGLYLDLFLAYFGGRWSLFGPPPESKLYPIGGKAGMGIIHGLGHLIGPAGTLILLIGTLLMVLALFTKLRVPELGWLRAIFTAIFAHGEGKPEPEAKPLIAAPSLDRQEAAAGETSSPKPQAAGKEPEPEPKREREPVAVPRTANRPPSTVNRKSRVRPSPSAAINR